MKLKINNTICILAGVLVAELLIYYGIILNKKNYLNNKYKSDSQIVQFNFEKDKKTVNDEFEKTKYLASGKTAYERIYNIQSQSIIELISNLARESFPDNWTCETKVEEFTNFILLVYNKTPGRRVSVKSVAKYILPIVKHSSPYLKNIAVYNKKHKCIMYFDERAIKEIKRTKTISDIASKRIVRNGKYFKRYDAITIKYEEINGHIFVPAIIGGNVEIAMMLDTGASITVISKEVAGKTMRENEDINKVEQREFTTASGKMICPILIRKISVGSIDVEQEVAVNFKDDMNLLGVDFFKNYHYITDSKTKSIYLWSK